MSVFRLSVVVMGLMCVYLTQTRVCQADSSYLYGIHWYGDPNNSIVENMTGNRGIWSLEIVVPYSDSWWQASGQQWKFQTMVSRGHSIICRIEPNWGMAIPNDEDLEQYLADVQATASLLADSVHIWHVGNEMNLYQEWGGNELTPEHYISAYKQIRDAIKSVSSPLGEQIVLVGPVSPGGVIANVRHTEGLEYLQRMCAQLGPDDCDGFAIHSYGAPWGYYPAAVIELYDGYRCQTGVIDANGFADKPVYITEWNRRVEPISDEREAQTAMFLHHSFAQLNSWNQMAGAHPIAGACWFIYSYDNSTWAQYSIEYLHTVGPAGQDNDLWDAFQYSCTQDYPAGYPDIDTNAAVTPFSPADSGTRNIALDSASISASSIYSINYQPNLAIDGIITQSSKWVSRNEEPPHWLQLDLGCRHAIRGVILRCAGAAGENWQFNLEDTDIQLSTSLDAPWITSIEAVTPGQGPAILRRFTNPQVARRLRLMMNDPGTDNIVRLPEIEVYAYPAGDLTFDGDVDLQDFSMFADCFGGPQQSTPSTDCDETRFLLSDLNEDGFVDLEDFGILQTIMNQP